jgi:carboxypeptidase C (cathepsin A)
MNRWIIIILFSAWHCFFQPAEGAYAQEEEAKTAPSALNGAVVLDASNGSTTQHSLKIDNKKIDYTASAASITVQSEQSAPVGRIFYISYCVQQKGQGKRPLTFVFNGGPGAASAYLHIGAIGPQRVVFNEDGSVPPMPARIVENSKSWLAFTDLVFVDPIGTGYSREIKQDQSTVQENNESKTLKFSDNPTGRAKAWGVEEDIDSLARFIRTYLTQEDRWLSPIYLAGESYGGFRVARLSELLQSDFGIALNGLVLISPALDFSVLWGDERSLWPWVALLPSYAATAAIHQRSEQTTYVAEHPRESVAKAEQFAMTDYLTGLAAGSLEQDRFNLLSRLTGLDAQDVKRWAGRVPPVFFAKQLLSDKGFLVSLYDGSITQIDPNPARQILAGGDPYLDSLNAPVTAAFNSYVRNQLNFRTDLPYLLLNEAVFESWNWRSGIQGEQGFVEAVTDLKQALSLNPDMRVFIAHGVFDLVTPYFASEIAIRQMGLHQLIRNNISLNIYHGGHMPYLHRKSLDAMFEDADRFFSASK